jgi:hypothetical protein
MIILSTLLLFAAQAAPHNPSGAEQVVSPEKGDAEDSLERAATKPLRDLNLMKPEIKAELAAIVADPYDTRRLRGCKALNNEAQRMTALVGPDVDDPSLKTKKGRDPVEQVLDNAEGIVGSFIPGGGIIRELSGANKAAREAAAARLAGQLRRSHVKGIMKAQGCKLTPAPAPKAAPAKR